MLFSRFFSSLGGAEQEGARNDLSPKLMHQAEIYLGAVVEDFTLRYHFAFQWAIANIMIGSRWFSHCVPFTLAACCNFRVS
jgi:hypothetical protein